MSSPLYTQYSEEELSLPLYISHLATLALTVSYVGVLYISPKTRPSETRRRDDIDVVIHRLYVISMFTAVNVMVIVPGLLTSFGVYTNWTSAWLSLGISIDLHNFILYPGISLLVTMILYIGPLVDLLMFDYQGSIALLVSEAHQSMLTVHGIRNYLIGPLTEEFIFRGCVIGLYLSSNVGKKFMVFVTPLFFAIAHGHHFYEEYLHVRTHSPESRSARIKQLLLVTILQFAYTSVFGWYVAYIFICTHSVWACIAIHIFCNSMGLPAWSLDTDRKTRFYRALLVLGAVGFGFALRILPARLGI